MAHDDRVCFEKVRRKPVAQLQLDPRQRARWWEGLTASLRELLHPLVVAYLGLAVGLDAVRAYSYWPDLDLPMHYAGALALTYVVDRGVARTDRRMPHPAVGGQRALTVFALVCTISMFWEIGEYLSDRFLGTHAQTGLDDTMTDALIDVLGSLSFLLARSLARRRGSRRRRSFSLP